MSLGQKEASVAGGEGEWRINLRMLEARLSGLKGLGVLFWVWDVPESFKRKTWSIEIQRLIVPSWDPLDHLPFFYWHPPVKVTIPLSDLDVMLLSGWESGRARKHRQKSPCFPCLQSTPRCGSSLTVPVKPLMLCPQRSLWRHSQCSSNVNTFYLPWPPFFPHSHQPGLVPPK